MCNKMAVKDLPIIKVQGRRSGSTLALLAGIHGDEYVGPQVVWDVIQAVTHDVHKLRGTLIAVPVAHVAALKGNSRVSPLDRKNLARVFPGDPAGSATERLAYFLAHEIIARADFLIDIHTGGTFFDIPPLCGYLHRDDEIGRRSWEAAKRFNVQVLWGHSSVPQGRTISYALSRNIPWVYTETSSCDEAAVKTFYNGVMGVLQYLKMVPGNGGKIFMPERHFVSSGDIDSGIKNNEPGVFIPRVRVLDRVSSDEPIGAIRDPSGQILEEVRTPVDGTVVVLHRVSWVNEGEPLAVIAPSSYASKGNSNG